MALQSCRGGGMEFLKRLMGESPSLDYTGPTGGYLIVDVETSGLYPSQGHKITWLGTAYVVDGSVSEGLSVAMAGTNGLAVFGDAPASVPRHDARVALGWFANAAVAAQAVAAHNAAFDSRFMHATSQAVGQPMPTTSWLCTMLLARHFFPLWPNHKLTTCLREAGISLPREHDAGDEALATGHLLGFLLAHARGQGVTDLEDLLTIGGVDPEQAAEQSLGEASRGGSAGVSMMIDLSALTRDDVNRARTVCGDLLMEQITDPAHRAAHELEDALFGEGRDKRIEAYQALTDAGCPEAARFWRNLPYWWGTGGKGEFDGSVYVLNKYREMGFEDTEDIRELCVNASSDVYNLKAGPGMLLKAHEQLWEWLSRFGTCRVEAKSGMMAGRPLSTGDGIEASGGEVCVRRLVPQDAVVDGFRIAHGVHGTGRPVVLIHGTPSSSFIWRDVVPHLVAAGCRVHVFDLLGYGLSERPQDPGVDTSVSGQVGVVLGLMDQWGLPDAAVVGHDIGGAVAQRLAVLHPRRVTHLTLVDTCSFDSWPSARTREQLQAGLDALLAADPAKHREHFSSWLLSTVVDKQRLREGALDYYLDLISGPVGQASFFQHQVAHYDSRHTIEISDRLAELTSPHHLGRAGHLAGPRLGTPAAPNHQRLTTDRDPRVRALRHGGPPSPGGRRPHHRHQPLVTRRRHQR